MVLELHHGGGGGESEQQGAQQAPQQQQQAARRGWWWQGRGRGAPARKASGGEALDALLGGRTLVTLAFSDMVVSGGGCADDGRRQCIDRALLRAGRASWSAVGRPARLCRAARRARPGPCIPYVSACLCTRIATWLTQH